MRILIVHNAYQQRGGEDSVVEAELAMLRERGHEVELFGRDNRAIETMSRLALAVSTVWSAHSHRDFAQRLESVRPDVVHVHNTFPLISPAVIWAAHARRIPVVHTLHNFRLLCPQAMFLRNDQVCESCLGRAPVTAVARGCYRDSRVQTGVLAAMLMTHRGVGTFRNRVARYIALTEFSRKKFIAGGFAPDRVVVKGNFVDVPAFEEGERSGPLFVGRLSAEKGISVLAKALKLDSALRMCVIGDGPEREQLPGTGQVEAKGVLPQAATLRRMQGAECLVLPSICYENFPRTLVEAYACGLPVIASRSGALEELVDHGRTGLLFSPGSAEELAGVLAWARDNPHALREMGRNARAEYERKYTCENNYLRLMAIYQDAIVATGLEKNGSRAH
ncbi:MAG: glycosyltransferase [Betaproteobacteria bacterium]|nr:glycosyltransferase [Betaproteobacteria bacterium]